MAAVLKSTLLEGLPSDSRRYAKVCLTGAFVLKSNEGCYAK
jgi:hypothetical protein